MRPQIVHETEVHRQHVRLKIPIQVEIDGIRYQVDDWSIGGLAVESVMTSRKPDEKFSVRLIFPFEEFEMTMRREARMVYVDQGHGRFGCDFLAVSERHAEVLRYLVDAYLAGEVVSAGDILQARARGNTAHRPLSGGVRAGADERAAARHPALSAPMRRSALAGLALLAVVAFGIWERYFAIEVLTATIEAPVVEVRAPIAGRFVSALEPGERGPRRRRARQGPGFGRRFAHAREPVRLPGARPTRSERAVLSGRRPAGRSGTGAGAADGAGAAARSSRPSGSASAIAPRSTCRDGASPCSARSRRSTSHPPSRRCASGAEPIFAAPRRGAGPSGPAIRFRGLRRPGFDPLSLSAARSAYPSCSPKADWTGPPRLGSLCSFAMDL